MLAELIRQALTRRTTTGTYFANYKCGKCGFSMKITNENPDRIGPILDIALGHACKPRPKAL
ncbi:hypothetical protein ACFWUQ_22830 [Streptomyces sp. NPDC058662]|uniref:hypothetical protein n=1 Tax=Streptomyces sp. NPDC058662 TaxID=3346583 RepID=UPI003668CDDC